MSYKAESKEARMARPLAEQMATYDYGYFMHRKYEVTIIRPRPYPEDDYVYTWRADREIYMSGFSVEVVVESTEDIGPFTSFEAAADHARHVLNTLATLERVEMEPAGSFRLD